MELSPSGTPWKANQFVNLSVTLDVLQSFDSEVTNIVYLEDKESIITSSKGKSIKVWALPKEWRDAKLVADQRKQAGKRLNEHNKMKVANAVKKAELSSDEDDLAGWHLD